MPSLIPNFETLEKRLARLPVVTHRAREAVLTAGSKTGELLFLRSGAVQKFDLKAWRNDQSLGGRGHAGRGRVQGRDGEQQHGCKDTGDTSVQHNIHGRCGGFTVSR